MMILYLDGLRDEKITEVVKKAKCSHVVDRVDCKKINEMDLHYIVASGALAKEVDRCNSDVCRIYIYPDAFDVEDPAKVIVLGGKLDGCRSFEWSEERFNEIITRGYMEAIDERFREYFDEDALGRLLYLSSIVQKDRLLIPVGGMFIFEVRIEKDSVVIEELGLIGNRFEKEEFLRFVRSAKKEAMTTIVIDEDLEEL